MSWNTHSPDVARRKAFVKRKSLGGSDEVALGNVVPASGSSDNGHIDKKELNTYMLSLAILTRYSERVTMTDIFPGKDRKNYFLRLYGSKTEEEEEGNVDEENWPMRSLSLPQEVLKILLHRFEEMARSGINSESNKFEYRVYFAFYAYILKLSDSPGAFERISRDVNLLFARFFKCLEKEVVYVPKSVRLKTQLTVLLSFIDMLLSIITDSRENTELIRQLEDFKMRVDLDTRCVWRCFEKIVKFVDNSHMTVLNAITTCLDDSKEELLVRLNELETLLSDEIIISEFAIFLRKFDCDKHPTYSVHDYLEQNHWKKFVDLEKKETAFLSGIDVEGLPLTKNGRIIFPENPRVAYNALIECFWEKHSSAVLVNSNELLQLSHVISLFWRMHPPTQTALFLALISKKISEDAERLCSQVIAEKIKIAFQLSHGIQFSNWLLCDKHLAKISTTNIWNSAISKIYGLIPLLYQRHVIELEQLLSVVGMILRQNMGIKITETHTKTFRYHLMELGNQIILDSKKKNHICGRLDFESLIILGKVVIRSIKILRERYSKFSFGDVSITDCVTTELVKKFQYLLESALKNYVKSRNNANNFLHIETIQFCHGTICELCQLSEEVHHQTTMHINFEKAVFPNLIEWVRDAGQKTLLWVGPALSQDSLKPIDADAGIMYSSSIVDLFKSFDSYIRLIRNLHCQSEDRLTRLLGIATQAVCNAISEWGTKTVELFNLKLDEFRDDGTNLDPNDGSWLDLLKGAVENLQTTPKIPKFPQELCIFLNNVEAAMDFFFKFSEEIDSRSIAKKLRAYQRRTTFQRKSYLYSINIKAAKGIQLKDLSLSKQAYITLVDQDNRKQLGKTRMTSGLQELCWNQSFEISSVSAPKHLKAILWRSKIRGNHDILGRADIRLDPKDFGDREYGSITKRFNFDTHGQLQVVISMDLETEDIQFHIGKTLRLLKNYQNDMISALIQQFSESIHAEISRCTFNTILPQYWCKLAAIDSWIHGKSIVQSPPTRTEIENLLEPLFDYFNEVFSVLSSVLTRPLCQRVIAGTWEIVLEAIEGLVLPSLKDEMKNQKQLTLQQLEMLFVWINVLCDFFYNDGAGPEIEVLRSQQYQTLMMIPIYYDLPSSRLKDELSVLNSKCLRLKHLRNAALERRNSIKTHRDQKMMRQQEAEFEKAQLAVSSEDTIILKILKMRGESDFVNNFLKSKMENLDWTETEKLVQDLIK